MIRHELGCTAWHWHLSVHHRSVSPPQPHPKLSSTIDPRQVQEREEGIRSNKEKQFVTSVPTYSCSRYAPKTGRVAPPKPSAGKTSFTRCVASPNTPRPTRLSYRHLFQILCLPTPVGLHSGPRRRLHPEHRTHCYPWLSIPVPTRRWSGRLSTACPRPATLQVTTPHQILFHHLTPIDTLHHHFHEGHSHTVYVRAVHLRHLFG